MTVRIYAVEDVADGQVFLVKANTQAQALRHVARNIFRVQPATALEVAALMADGQKVEDATEEEKPADNPAEKQDGGGDGVSQ